MPQLMALIITMLPSYIIWFSSKQVPPPEQLTIWPWETTLGLLDVKLLQATGICAQLRTTDRFSICTDSFFSVLTNFLPVLVDTF
jgi:hypothetical protein